MIFNNLADINTIIFNGHDVQHLVYNGVTIWNKSSPAHDYSLDYLTFEVLSGTTSIQFAQQTQSGNVNKVINYSINDGEWVQISTGSSIYCSNGDKIRFKAINTTSYTNDNSSNYNRNYTYFHFGNRKVNVYGNIMSLIYGDDFVGTSLASTNKYAFCSLFKQPTTVTGGIVDASNLILPVASTEGCFRAMFSTNKQMIAGPREIRLVENGSGANYMCYYMFENCTSLVTAPNLPTINNTGSYIYGLMFTGCTSLTLCRCYIIHTSTNQIGGMFRNITTNGTLYKNANETWPTGTSYIPSTWTIVDAA